MITDSNSMALWDEYDENMPRKYVQDSPSSSDVSDKEKDGYSRKKKKRKKKVNKTVIKRSESSVILKERKKEKELKNLSRTGFKIKVNHRYRIDDGRIGICRFRGRTLFGKSSQDWVGILVEHGEGVHNGTIKGKTYFRCADGKGIMVRPQRIIEDLGPNDHEITNKMIKGSKQIRHLLEQIAYENQLEYQQKLKEKKRKKKNKQNENYKDNEYDQWRPPRFQDYEEDHSEAFSPKGMYSKTLFDSDTKPAKKLQMYEI